MNETQKRIFIRAALLIAVFGAALALFLSGTDRSLSGKYAEKRETGNREFMESGTVTWNGEKYRRKNAVTSLLIAGTDRTDTSAGYRRTSYRNGGQADFLLLVVMDHAEKKVHQLQIDRDTMTDVTVLGVYGNETGTRTLQISLSHSFGARPEDNAKYTVRAVRTLMEGMEIDGYYMIDYSAVPALNDLLGGVPVTIPEDMTSVNPEWYEGHTITLKGEDAENFVRTRQTVGRGTNEERMSRQNIYMQAAIREMNRRASESTEFLAEMLNALSRQAETNRSQQRLAEELSRARTYEILPVDYLPGEYKLADNGFMEFYPEETGPAEWIMNHLYIKR